MRSSTKSRGFTLTEAMATLVAGVLLLAALLPALASSGRSSGVDVSISNLRTLWSAHQLYAGDWNGRQMTLVADNFAAVGGFSGFPGDHPPIQLGWACESSNLWAYWFNNLPINAALVWPINPNTRYGWFRMPNAKVLHDYVNGQFYEATYYAPNDSAVLNAVNSAFATPCEFFNASGVTFEPAWWSSYCLSPAALFDPAVLARRDPQGAFSVPDGFTVPSFAQVK